MKNTALAALLLLLAACGSSKDDRAAGGVSAGEAKALDDAAEMVEARRVPAEAIPSAPPSN